MGGGYPERGWWLTKLRMQMLVQVLSTRKRKDAEQDDIQVQVRWERGLGVGGILNREFQVWISFRIKVCLFAFDLIYLNGKSFINEPLKVRREALHQNFKEIAGLCLGGVVQCGRGDVGLLTCPPLLLACGCRRV